MGCKETDDIFAVREADVGFPGGRSGGGRVRR